MIWRKGYEIERLNYTFCLAKEMFFLFSLKVGLPVY